jgi:hypothetical protein
MVFGQALRELGNSAAVEAEPDPVCWAARTFDAWSGDPGVGGRRFLDLVRGSYILIPSGASQSKHVFRRPMGLQRRVPVFSKTTFVK